MIKQRDEKETNKLRKRLKTLFQDNNNSLENKKFAFSLNAKPSKPIPFAFSEFKSQNEQKINTNKKDFTQVFEKKSNKRPNCNGSDEINSVKKKAKLNIELNDDVDESKNEPQIGKAKKKQSKKNQQVPMKKLEKQNKRLQNKIKTTEPSLKNQTTDQQPNKKQKNTNSEVKPKLNKKKKKKAKKVVNSSNKIKDENKSANHLVVDQNTDNTDELNEIDNVSWVNYDNEYLDDEDFETDDNDDYNDSESDFSDCSYESDDSYSPDSETESFYTESYDSGSDDSVFRDNLFIHKGTAIKRDLNEDDNIKFETEESQVIEIEETIHNIDQPQHQHRDELLKLNENFNNEDFYTKISKILKENKIAHQDETDEECPELVPINKSFEYGYLNDNTTDSDDSTIYSYTDGSDNYSSFYETESVDDNDIMVDIIDGTNLKKKLKSLEDNVMDTIEEYKSPNIFATDAVIHEVNIHDFYDESESIQNACAENLFELKTNNTLNTISFINNKTIQNVPMKSVDTTKVSSKNNNNSVELTEVSSINYNKINDFLKKTVDNDNDKSTDVVQTKTADSNKFESINDKKFDGIQKNSVDIIKLSPVNFTKRKTVDIIENENVTIKQLNNINEELASINDKKLDAVSHKIVDLIETESVEISSINKKQIDASSHKTVDSSTSDNTEEEMIVSTIIDNISNNDIQNQSSNQNILPASANVSVTIIPSAKIRRPAENRPMVSKFYKVMRSRQFLVILREDIHLYGTLKLTNLTGNIEIFGHAPAINTELEIFSPRGYSMITIALKPIDKQLNDIENALKGISGLFSDDQINNIRCEFNPETDALILLRPNTEKRKLVINFKKFMKENVFPNFLTLQMTNRTQPIERLLNCFLNSECNKSIEMPPFWYDLPLESDSKLMIIGGKSVGKSTLLKFIINRHIARFKRILLIDLDIGQSEIFLPQTISCTIITEPLLGPGYFYNIQPNMSIWIGHLNISLCPYEYLRAVMQLLNYCYKEFVGIPWIVNTMGYNQGFGLELLSKITKYLQATTIVQLQSKKPINNFKYHLKPSILNNIESVVYNADEFATNVQIEYRLIVMTSEGERQYKEWEMSPKDTRYSMLLTRLSDALIGTAEYLNDCKPLSASFSNFRIITSIAGNYSSYELLRAAQGNLIYLCKWEGEDQTIECIGIGVVRAIDFDNQLLYLIPALPLKLMCRVNCLALGNISLPNAFYINQGSTIKYGVPYVYTTDKANATKAIKQIYHRPAKFLTGKHKNLK